MLFLRVRIVAFVAIAEDVRDRFVVLGDITTAKRLVSNVVCLRFASIRRPPLGAA